MGYGYIYLIGKIWTNKVWTFISWSYMSKISPTGPLEDTPGPFTKSFCLGISFFVGLGKAGVSSQGMWAKSLNMGGFAWVRYQRCKNRCPSWNSSLRKKMDGTPPKKKNKVNSNKQRIVLLSPARRFQRWFCHINFFGGQFCRDVSDVTKKLKEVLDREKKLPPSQTCLRFSNLVWLPPQSLTLPLKSYLPNRKVVFQSLFFRGYVKLQGCI